MGDRGLLSTGSAAYSGTSPSSFSDVSFVTLASHTCVVRPVCRGDAVAMTRSPSLALEMKLVEQSIVVKLLAPSGQWWFTPKAHSASASVMTTGAQR